MAENMFERFRPAASPEASADNPFKQYAKRPTTPGAEPEAATPATPVAARPTVPDRTWGDVAKDTVLGIGQGTLNIASSMTDLGERMQPTGLARTAVGLARRVAPTADLPDIPEAGQLAMRAGAALSGVDYDAPTNAEATAAASKMIGDKLSPELQAEKQELADTEGFWNSAKKVATSPALLGQFAAEQVPNLITLGQGSRVSAGIALEGVVARALAGGATKEAAELAGREAAKAGAEKFIIGANAGMEGGAAAVSAQQEALALPDEIWAANPAYTAMIARGVDPQDAKRDLSKDTAELARVLGATFGVVGGKISAPFEADVFTRGLARRPAAMLKGAASEAAEETIQEGGGQFAQNVALQTVDPERELMAGVPEAAGTGAVLGAVMGGGLALGGAAASTDRVARRPEPSVTPAGPLSQAADPAAVDVVTPAARPFPEAAPGTLADVANMLPDLPPAPQPEPPSAEQLDKESKRQPDSDNPQDPGYVRVRDDYPAQKWEIDRIVTARREAKKLGDQKGVGASLHAEDAYRASTMRTDSLRDDVRRLTGKDDAKSKFQLKAFTAELEQRGQLTDDTAPLSAPSNLPPPPWVDQETGVMRDPTDDEIEDVMHSVINNGLAGGGINSRVLKQVLQDQMGVKPDRVAPILAKVKADRKNGLTAPAPKAAAADELEQDRQDLDGVTAPSSSAPTGEPQSTVSAEPAAEEATPALPEVPAADTPSTSSPTASIPELPPATPPPSIAAPAADGQTNPRGPSPASQPLSDQGIEPLQQGTARAAAPESASVPQSASDTTRYDESTEQLDDDLTPASGGSFSDRRAADMLARRTPGGRVFPVDDGGFVVRTPSASTPAAADVEEQATPAGEAAPDALHQAAHAAATSEQNDRPEPTEAQKEAGNYKKGHARVAGLDISIENPAGSRRRPEWPPLTNHYGYFKGSIGADKDHVDVFLTERAGDESLPVFVVDQKHRNGKFDEHKVVMGAATEEDARAAYLSNYEKGWTGLQGIKQFTQEEFKAWVKDPAQTTKPAAGVANSGTSVTEPKPRKLGIHERTKEDDQADAESRAARDALQTAAAPTGKAIVQPKPKKNAAVAEEMSEADMAARKDRNRTPPAVEGDTWDTAKVLRDKPVGGTVTIEDGGPNASADGGTRWKKLKNGDWTDGTTTLDINAMARRLDSDPIDNLPAIDVAGAAAAVRMGRSVFPIESLAEAQEKFIEWRNRTGAGNRETPAVLILDKAGDTIAHFSYNGRMWNGPVGSPKKEILLPAQKSIGQAIADNIAADPALTPAKGAALANATAPEHVASGMEGVTVDELKEIAAEMRSHIDAGGDTAVTHIFDAPKAADVVRLQEAAGVTSKLIPDPKRPGKRIKFYSREGGWMTAKEARERIDSWEARALEQGRDPEMFRANSKKIVLSLFDLTGSWSEPWEQAGYQVYRFDIQDDSTYEDPETGEERKVGDINNMSVEFFGDLFGDFDGLDVHAILAACPCTDFTNAGAKHFAAKDADGRTVSSIALVQQTMAAIEYFKPAVWALENPVGRIEELTGLPPWRMAFEPFHLGDDYTKKTLLWGRFNGNLPIAPVTPNASEGGRADMIHQKFGGKSMATKNARSATPAGFAYGFFMANNAIDNPALAVTGKYDRLDPDLITRALAAGLTPGDIDELVEEDYYETLDDKAANASLRDALRFASMPGSLESVTKPGTALAVDDGQNDELDGEMRSYEAKGERAAVLADLAQAMQGSSRPVDGAVWMRTVPGKWSDGDRVITSEQLADLITGAPDANALEGEFSRVDAKKRAGGAVVQPKPERDIPVEVVPGGPAGVDPGPKPDNLGEVSDKMRVAPGHGNHRVATGWVGEQYLEGIGETHAEARKALYDKARALQEAPAATKRAGAAVVSPKPAKTPKVASPAAVADIPANAAPTTAQGTPNGTDTDAATGTADGRGSDRGAVAGGVQDLASEGGTSDLFGAPIGGDAREDRPARRPTRGAKKRLADIAEGASDPGDKGPGDRARAVRVPVNGKPGERNFNVEVGGLTRTGSWMDAARRNVDAMALALQLQEQNRVATLAEQELLSKYVGFGASEVANRLFPVHAGATAAKYDPERIAEPGWKAIAQKLKDTLTVEQLATVMKSTQYAHYTSETVTRSIWSAMEQMGFTGGKVFEPGMGHGNFPMTAPKDIASKIAYTGLEMDHLTAAIGKQLVQGGLVLRADFTKQKLPNDTFDIAVGNPPFASTVITADADYRAQRFMLHDYFFAKTIDKVRPGGLMAFVTSAGTMNKGSEKARQYIAERADLLGAIRLPDTAFLQNAGTEVVTDILFFRKREAGELAAGEQWMKLEEISLPRKDGSTGTTLINEYFVAHPEMVMGQHNLTGSMYRADTYNVTLEEGTTLEDLLPKAIAKLPKAIYTAAEVRRDRALNMATAEADLNPDNRKEGGLYVKDGRVYVTRTGAGVALANSEKLSAKEEAWLGDAIGLRDSLKVALDDQRKEGDWKKSLKALEKAYKAFTATHGAINEFTESERTERYYTNEDGDDVKLKGDQDPPGGEEARERIITTRRYKNKRLLAMDVESPLLMALEKETDDGKLIGAKQLTERSISPPKEPVIESTTDALIVSLNRKGYLDIDSVAELAKLPVDQVIQDLGERIYQSPLDEDWEMADAYLSGDVVTKLEEAEAASRIKPEFQRNVDALRAVQPQALTPRDITVSLGMTWLEPEIINQFAAEVLGVNKAAVKYSSDSGQWSMNSPRSKYARQAEGEFNHADRSAGELLDAVLNNRQIKVTRTKTKEQGGGTYTDVPATTAVNELAKKMRARFSQWIWEDADRAQKLAGEYNQLRNRVIPRTFAGEFIDPPGLAIQFKPDPVTGEGGLHPHQKRAIWRQIQTGTTYLAHAVGAGKTLEMIIGGMEQKRLGLISKPMYTVPNHVLGQFSAEFLEAYPTANIMVADEDSFTKEKRQQFIAAATVNAPDAIIISHSALRLLRVKPETMESVLADLVADLEAAIEEMDGDDDRIGRKKLEGQLENLRQKFEGKADSEKQDDVVFFEDMGVDFMYVDEAHEFRKLDFVTNRQNVKGISPIGSAMALDLYAKTRYLHGQRPGRSHVLASGTPVTNTMGELYTVQKFLDYDGMRAAGLHHFDAWASEYGQVATEYERNAAGQYKPVERFAKFNNLPELMQQIRERMDVLTSTQLGQLVKRPDVEGGQPNMVVVEASEELTSYMAETLSPRIAASLKWKPSKDEPYNPDPMLAIIGDARLAVIDMRFVDPTGPADPNSKLNRMADDIIAKHKEYSSIEFTDRDGKKIPGKGATQIVFSPIGFGAGVAKRRGFDTRAWLNKRFREAGIPLEQIAWMQDYDTNKKRKAVFREMRAGRVRVLIGSPANMGTGVNVQNRLRALHFLSPPWFPSDVEQPHGRILRQGNLNAEVSLNWYVTEGTYDSTGWGMVSRKGKFIEQVMQGDRSQRSAEDISEVSQYALASALASGDDRAVRVAELEADIGRLTNLQGDHEKSVRVAQGERHSADNSIDYFNRRIARAEAAAALLGEDKITPENFTAAVKGKKLAGAQIFGYCYLYVVILSRQY